MLSKTLNYYKNIIMNNLEEQIDKASASNKPMYKVPVIPLINISRDNSPLKIKAQASELVDKTLN